MRRSSLTRELSRSLVASLWSALVLALSPNVAHSVDISSTSTNKATSTTSNEHEGGGNAARVANNPNHRFETVGIYVRPPVKEQSHLYDFYKACGYNYFEFCDAGFSSRPDRLEKYYADLSVSVAESKRRGFKVWILLLSCMKQFKGPEDVGGSGTFCVLNKELRTERLGYIKQAVQGLTNADGFAFFAGDPGGDPEGKSTVQDCIALSLDLEKIVRESAPKAGFMMNIWAIGEWEGFPSPWSLKFWQNQVNLSKAVVSEKGILGLDCGISFSMDNYYRSLTLACYAGAGIKPELYPVADDVKKLRQRGVKPILGWPYFLVDEVDDGFITPNNVAMGGSSQAETRYIRAIIDHGREIGVDGLVANSAYVAAEALNIYAFGRMCHAPNLSPEAFIDEYASYIAEPKMAVPLAQILRFIENNGNWQNSLPEQFRLKNFDCEVKTAQEALNRLEKIVPRDKAPIPLPEPPAQYLVRLKNRLQDIAAGKIGGFTPIVKAAAGK